MDSDKQKQSDNDAQNYDGALVKITKTFKCKNGKYLIAFQLKTVDDNVHNIVVFKDDKDSFIKWLKKNPKLHIFGDPNSKYNNITGFYIKSLKEWNANALTSKSKSNKSKSKE